VVTLPWHKIQPSPDLWQRLRKRQIDGVKFRRQVPIERFIVDFCSFEKRLIVEIDGPVHDYSEEADKVRDEYLRAVGFRVLRVRNEAVFQSLETIVETIRQAVAELTPT